MSETVVQPETTRSWSNWPLAILGFMVSLAIPFLMWGEGDPSSARLQVFLLGWGACGLLISILTVVPDRTLGQAARSRVLWLGAGLLLGLTLGTGSWTEPTTGPVWSFWLAVPMAAGFYNALRNDFSK